MKLKYLSYILLGSVFTMSQVSATTVNKKTNLQKPSASKVLDNNWSGAYVGLQYSFGINKYKNPHIHVISALKPANGIFGEARNLGDTQVGKSVTNYSHLAGLFLGYNYTITEQFIVGAELDASYKLKADEIYYNNHAKLTEKGIEVKQIELPLNRYLDSSLRARVGVTLGSLLPYLAGGINIVYDLPNHDFENFAKSRLKKGNLDEDELKKITTNTKRDSNLHVGWTLGAGFEYKLHKNLSIRADYRYNNISYQPKKIAFEEPVIYNNTVKFVATYGLESLSSHDVRIGFSYHF